MLERIILHGILTTCLAFTIRVIALFFISLFIQLCPKLTYLTLNMESNSKIPRGVKNGKMCRVGHLSLPTGQTALLPLPLFNTVYISLEQPDNIEKSYLWWKENILWIFLCVLYIFRILLTVKYHKRLNWHTRNNKLVVTPLCIPLLCQEFIWILLLCYFKHKRRKRRKKYF